MVTLDYRRQFVCGEVRSTESLESAAILRHNIYLSENVDQIEL